METKANPAPRYAVRTLFALALFGAVVAWAAGPARAAPPARSVVPTPIQLSTGTMQVDLREVAATGTVTLTFTYTADPHGFGLKAGTVTLNIPDGWTTPTTSAPGAAGYVDTDAQCRAPSCAPTVSNMTITVSGVTLAAGASFIIRYSHATAPGSVATFDFTAQETPAAGYATMDLPPVRVTTCANGVGVMTVSPRSVTDSATGTFMFLFTYTAAGCGLLAGSAVTLDVPAGWTPPSAKKDSPGYTTVSPGAVTLSSSQITINDAILQQGQTLTISYTDAVPASPGSSVFDAYEQSGGGATLVGLLSSPQVTVLRTRSSSPPIAATMTVFPAAVTVSRRSTLTFTYTPPGGGLPPSGTVALDVPPGWTAPTRKRGAPGYTSASAGIVSVAGRRITVTGTALAPPGALTITYRRGIAPRSPGRTEFTARQSLSGAARFSLLAQLPVITMASPAGPVPSWLIPVLVAALAAACATVAALAIRLHRTRVRPAPATAVAAVPHPDPPRVAAVETTGNEPTLALRIEPHPGNTRLTLRK